VNSRSPFLADPVSRRAFMARMTAAGLGTVAAFALTGCDGDSSGSSTGIPDPTNFPGITGRSVTEAVLNYALTLEILEADLYRQALNIASGKPITDPLAASPNSYSLTIAPGALANSTAAFLYLRDFAFVEAAHRDFLTAAIQSSGGTPVPRRANGYKFATANGQPGNDLATILTNILPLEETGVRAYLGAAEFMAFNTNADKNLVATAVAIHSTEARHSAAIAYVLNPTDNPGPKFLANDRRVTDGANAANTPSEDTFQYFLPPPVVLNAVTAFFA
jgi:hypothetical protein